MEKFIFIHIPKTAGNSFHNICRDSLSQYFHFRPRDGRRPGDTWIPTPYEFLHCKQSYSQYVQSFKDEIANHFQIGGHIRKSEIPNIRDRDFITVIRHPVDRLISHYSYFQPLESRNHYIHNNATNDMSLLEFAESQRNFISEWIGDPNDYLHIGLQEYFPEFLNWFSNYTGISPLVNRVDNKTSKKTIVTTKDRSLIESMNDIDMELYNSILRENNK
jgi:hypothetical protein